MRAFIASGQCVLSVIHNQLTILLDEINELLENSFRSTCSSLKLLIDSWQKFSLVSSEKPNFESEEQALLLQLIDRVLDAFSNDLQAVSDVLERFEGLIVEFGSIKAMLVLLRFSVEKGHSSLLDYLMNQLICGDTSSILNLGFKISQKTDGFNVNTYTVDQLNQEALCSVVDSLVSHQAVDQFVVFYALVARCQTATMHSDKLATLAERYLSEAQYEHATYVFLLAEKVTEQMGDSALSGDYHKKAQQAFLALDDDEVAYQCRELFRVGLESRISQDDDAQVIALIEELKKNALSVYQYLKGKCLQQGLIFFDTADARAQIDEAKAWIVSLASDVLVRKISSNFAHCSEFADNYFSSLFAYVSKFVSAASRINYQIFCALLGDYSLDKKSSKEKQPPSFFLIVRPDAFPSPENKAPEFNVFFNEGADHDTNVPPLTLPADARTTEAGHRRGAKTPPPKWQDASDDEADSQPVCIVLDLRGIDDCSALVDLINEQIETVDREVKVYLILPENSQFDPNCFNHKIKSQPLTFFGDLIATVEMLDLPDNKNHVLGCSFDSDVVSQMSSEGWFAVNISGFQGGNNDASRYAQEIMISWFSETFPAADNDPASNPSLIGGPAGGIF